MVNTLTGDNVAMHYETDNTNATFEVIAAPGAGKKILIFAIMLANDSAATGFKTLDIKSGSTTILGLSFNGTRYYNFGDDPLVLSTNEALNYTKALAADVIDTTVWYKVV